MKELTIINLAFTLFMAFYYLALKPLSFSKLNRWYFLAVLGFSFLLPYLPTGEFFKGGNIALTALPAITISDNQILAPITLTLTRIYFTGVFFMLCLFLFQFGYVLLQVLGSANIKDGSVRFHRKAGKEAFSFLGRIVLGEAYTGKEKDIILFHETIHRKQIHSLDIVLFNMARIICWFNPLVHLALREVRLNHEFMADFQSFKTFGVKYQQVLVNEALGAVVYPLTHPFFNQSILKLRILNMNRQQSNPTSKWRYAMILPLAALLFWYSSCSHANLESLEAGKAVSGQPDKNAQFGSGQQDLVNYFLENLRYPDALKEQGAEGTVVVSFTITEDGILKDAEVVSSSDLAFNNYAVEFVSAMPPWKPAIKDGKAVRSKMALPIKFKLDN